MRPLGERVVVKPIRNPEIRNGLWRPHEKTTFTQESKPVDAINRGEVVAVGQGVAIPIGTLAVFSDTAGVTVQVGGEEYRIMTAQNIAAVVDHTHHFRACGDCIVVKPDARRENINGLEVILPDDDPWRTARVVSAGPKSSLGMGERVMHRRDVGQVLFADQDLLVLRERDLLGVMQ